MADAKHGLEFLERGVGMLLDVRPKFFGGNAPFWAAVKYR
jgi:hypothetical protein